MNKMTDIILRFSLALLLLPSVAWASLVLSPTSLTGLTVYQGSSTTASVGLSADPSAPSNLYYDITPSGSGTGSSAVFYSSDCPFATAAAQAPSCTLTVTVDAFGLAPGSYGPVNVPVDYQYSDDTDGSGFLISPMSGSTSFTVSFQVLAPDADGDGVADGSDSCPSTPNGESVNVSGCGASQLDSDNDGVYDNLDQCPNTPAGASVNASGCSASQLDSDNDGVYDNLDQCPNTPAGASVNASGCSASQLDSDNDGVYDNLDQCPNTPAGASVNASGCSASQSADGDGDGVEDDSDECPNTPSGETVSSLGCSSSQLDPDGDGVLFDQCPNTPVGEAVDREGCSASQLDTDADGISNAIDQCPTTPAGESVDAQGCSKTEQDDDGDGVANDVDQCPNTPAGESVDAQGCSQSQKDDDGDGIANDVDQCLNTPAGESVNAQGCSKTEQDDDGDGVANEVDQCPNTPAGESVDAQGCAESERDNDGDGVANEVDQCPNTPAGESVDAQGCAESERDDDGDGVANDADQCPNTPAGESVNAQGCAESERDDDGDGVANDADQCPNTPAGESVNAQGCAESERDDDIDGVANDADQCPNTPAGESVDAQGCSQSQVDDDGDAVSNDADQCPNTPEGESVDAQGCAQAERDDDSDGVANEIDQCPNTPPRAQVDGTGCPTQEEVLDSLLDAAGGDEQLGATSEAISSSCTSEGLTGQLLTDCQALIGASINQETGVNQALNEITPERAVQANAQVQRANTVQDQNIGNRISALRGGARGVSVGGLSFSNGESRLSGDHLANAIDDILLPATGASADEEPMLLANSRWGVFLSGELSKAERDESSNSSAFKMDTTVITGGLDYRVSNNFVLGGAVSFTDGETRLADDKGNVDVSGTSFSVYGSLYGDRFYLDFSATYGDSEFDQSRRVGYVLGNGTQVAQQMLAEYDGETTSAYVGVGWDAVQTEWLVTFRASLDYLDSELDPFTEQASNASGSGAGWAVAIDGQSQDWLTGRLTGSVSRVFSASWGVIIPYVEVDIAHEFANDAALITGNFVGDLDGAKLVVTVDEPDKSYYRGRIGTSVQLPGGFSGFVDYGRLFAYDRWSEYTISGGLRYEF